MVPAAAKITFARSERVIRPVMASPCAISTWTPPSTPLSSAPSSASTIPVGRTMVYVSPAYRTAFSPAYLWLRTPPGFSCTMGTSIARRVSSPLWRAKRSTPADDTRTSWGLGAT